MPGLLDQDPYSQQQQQYSAGLLAPFRPAADEGMMQRFFGTNDPRDPRGQAMMALSAGLIRGDFASGLENANKAINDVNDRSEKRAFNNLAYTKSAYELAAMRNAAERDARIQQELRARGVFGGQGGGQGGGMPMQPTGADRGGVPMVGDTPMFSMAGQQPPQAAQGGGMGAPGMGGGAPMGGYGGAPQGAPQGGYSGGAPQGVPQGSRQGGYSGGAGGQSQQIYRQLLDSAEIHARNGNTKTAMELYQRAEAFKPKFSTTPQLMRDPRDNTLKYVVQNEDGGYQVLPFGAKPDISIEDLGDRKQAIDRNTVPDGRTFAKSMTPDARASNALGWANNRNAVDRLAYDRSQVGKPQFHDGSWFSPPTANNPQGSVATPEMPAGAAPKLTEAQGKATTFATRMKDASRVLDSLDGQAWPSTVNRAGFKADAPAWLPGGQAVAGLATAANNSMVPEKAQQLYQAQQNWVTANLRQESGATIGDPEMEKDIRKWFPQAGDGAALIKQKREARQVAEQAMLSQAGPGARMVDETIRRADAENAKRNAGEAGKGGAIPLPSMKPSDLKHGQQYTLPDGTVGKWDSLKRGFVR